jgi:hypothetical protein
MNNDLNQTFCKRKECKKQFHRNRTWHKFCSAICRNKYWNESKKERRITENENIA